jgi:phosphoglycolate phosphatase-like HAD superfamily hydrolase
MDKIILVFDGDDTCWHNIWQYEKARVKFFDFLYNEFKGGMPGLKFLVDRYYEIDHSLYPLWGIQRGRVFYAMYKTYCELAQHLGLEVDPKHEKRIFEIGDMPFDFYETEWVDGLREILLNLKKDKRFTLCLLTSYDANVWRDRAKHLEIDKYFDNVKTVWSRKSERDFIEVSGYCDEKHHNTLLYSIGNAAETDILTAVGISDRWRGLYVPHASSSPIFTTNKGEEPYMPPPLENERVITLKSVLELGDMDFDNFILRG